MLRLMTRLEVYLLIPFQRILRESILLALLRKILD